MIESFRHKGLKRLFEAGEKKGVNPQFVERIENILGLLDAAGKVQDIALPSFRLHALTGGLKGFWAVTVRANWRIIFRFEDGNARDVDLVDYH
jgi:proteic killer suppression protein